MDLQLSIEHVFQPLLLPRFDLDRLGCALSLHESRLVLPLLPGSGAFFLSVFSLRLLLGTLRQRLRIELDVLLVPLKRILRLRACMLIAATPWTRLLPPFGVPVMRRLLVVLVVAFIAVVGTQVVKEVVVS